MLGQLCMGVLMLGGGRPTIHAQATYRHARAVAPHQTWVWTGERPNLSRNIFDYTNRLAEGTSSTENYFLRLSTPKSIATHKTTPSNVFSTYPLALIGGSRIETGVDKFRPSLLGEFDSSRDRHPAKVPAWIQQRGQHVGPRRHPRRAMFAVQLGADQSCCGSSRAFRRGGSKRAVIMTARPSVSVIQ